MGMMLALLGLVACLGDKTLDEVDPEAAPAEPAYSEHIAPLMFDYCDSCHSPDGARVLGDIRTDTCEELKGNMEIVSEMVFDRQVMPPGGAERMTSEDQLTLQRWFDQGADCDQ